MGRKKTVVDKISLIGPEAFAIGDIFQNCGDLFLRVPMGQPKLIGQGDVRVNGDKGFADKNIFHRASLK